MEKFEIQRLRDIDIVSLLTHLGTQVDEHRRALCPFPGHADRHKGSFVVNREHSKCSCFSCGHRGVDTIGLVQLVLGKTFPEACQYLADNYGAPPISLKGEKSHMITGTFGGSYSSNVSPSRGLGGLDTFDTYRYAHHFLHPKLNDASRRFLFQERRISPRVASWYRLNSWTSRDGIDWLELPYYSSDGHLIGVQNRRLTPSDTKPRFLFQPGSCTSAFGLQIIPYLKPTDELWIAEGPTDLLAMASAGHHGIAVASATLIRPEDFLPLKERGILRWRMVHDNDPAGLQARDRIIQLANDLGASIIATPPPSPYKDFGEWWAKGGAEPANSTP